jgi:hypothetical protein
VRAVALVITLALGGPWRNRRQRRNKRPSPATGQREQAQDPLTTATTMYRAMDMRFWREQGQAEMAEFA